MSAIVEMLFNVHSEGGTVYRIRNNPDAAPGEDAGIVIEWSDNGGKEWDGYFFIAPDAIRGVAEAMERLKGEI